MRTTFAFSFYVRESKANRHGLAHIELGISLNGTRQFINLPMAVKPEEFNTTKRPKYVEDYLAGMRVRINEILSSLVMEHQPLTLDNLKSYLRTGGVKSYTVNDLATDFLKTCSARGVALEHMAKYTRVCGWLKDQTGPGAECNKITQQTIGAIESAIRKSYAPATACGYLTKLKAVIKFGMDNGKIVINPCQGLKVTKPKRKPDMISDADFKKMKNMDFSFNKSIERVRDLFLFACGSGLAYIDVSDLTPEDFKEVNGHLCVVKSRHKTGIQFCSVLLPWAAKIARKYNFDLKSICISNQKINVFLKTVQNLCGVKSVKSLHFHLARHYYANTLVNAGVNLTAIQSAGGWSSSKIIFQHYATISNETVVKEITSKAL